MRHLRMPFKSAPLGLTFVWCGSWTGGGGDWSASAGILSPITSFQGRFVSKDGYSVRFLVCNVDSWMVVLGKNQSQGYFASTDKCKIHLVVSVTSCEWGGTGGGLRL